MHEQVDLVLVNLAELFGQLLLYLGQYVAQLLGLIEIALVAQYRMDGLLFLH